MKKITQQKKLFTVGYIPWLIIVTQEIEVLLEFKLTI